MYHSEKHRGNGDIQVSLWCFSEIYKHCLIVFVEQEAFSLLVNIFMLKIVIVSLVGINCFPSNLFSKPYFYMWKRNCNVLLLKNGFNFLITTIIRREKQIVQLLFGTILKTTALSGCFSLSLLMNSK